MTCRSRIHSRVSQSCMRPMSRGTAFYVVFQMLLTIVCRLPNGVPLVEAKGLTFCRDSKQRSGCALQVPAPSHWHEQPSVFPVLYRWYRVAASSRFCQSAIEAQYLPTSTVCHVDRPRPASGASLSSSPRVSLCGLVMTCTGAASWAARRSAIYHMSHSCLSCPLFGS